MADESILYILGILLIFGLVLGQGSCASRCKEKGGVYLWREYECVKKDSVIDF